MSSTRRIQALILMTTFATACAEHTAQPSSPPPSNLPVAATPSAPPSAAVSSAIHTLEDGAWPGSGPHRWGSRSIELRQRGTVVEARIHDAIEFQGVGMTPAEKPPTNHRCTPWEAMPADVVAPATMPTATSCDSAKAMCDAMHAYYEKTQPPAANEWNETPYNRPIGECK